MDVVRFSLNLPENAAQAARDLADREGISVTEAIRLALLREKKLAELHAKGEKIFAEGPDGTKRELVLWPD